MIVALRVEIVRFFATNHRGNRVMGGPSIMKRSEVFGGPLGDRGSLPVCPFLYCACLRRFTATDLSLRAFYWSCRARVFAFFGHGVSFPDAKRCVFQFIEFELGLGVNGLEVVCVLRIYG